MSHTRNIYLIVLFLLSLSLELSNVDGLKSLNGRSTRLSKYTQPSSRVDGLNGKSTRLSKYAQQSSPRKPTINYPSLTIPKRQQSKFEKLANKGKAVNINTVHDVSVNVGAGGSTIGAISRMGTSINTNTNSISNVFVPISITVPISKIQISKIITPSSTISGYDESAKKGLFPAKKGLFNFIVWKGSENEVNTFQVSSIALYGVVALIIILFVINTVFLCYNNCFEAGKRIKKDKYSKVDIIASSDDDEMQNLKEIQV